MSGIQQVQVQHQQPAGQPEGQGQGANQNHGQGAPTRPANYPSPTYSSPSLAPAQQYAYPQPPPQAPDQQQYRTSPTGSNGSMSLPGIRSIDPMQPPPAQQQQQQHNMANLQQQVPMGNPYYHHQGSALPHPQHSQYANVTSDPSGQGMRYALPTSGDSRIMSGGRHKKEIKRRTKTGCLTCRKRRIKCDEQHPACRNCQKSKRECLGYDPIFKQSPGPAAIQPAPTSGSSMGGSPASSNPYGNQPHMLQGYGAHPNMPAYDPALSSGVPQAPNQYDYASAIDPSLSEAAAPPAMNRVIPAYETTSPAKRTVEQLLDLGGEAPPKGGPDVAGNPQLIDEIKHLYFSIYAPGLENFLESKWFSVKGLSKLLTGRKYLDDFGSLLVQFAKTQQDDPKEIAYTSSVEGRVVWSLATMVKTSAAENGAREHKTVPASDDANEAGDRLDIFETLLTGRVAAGNPLTRPVPLSTDHHRLRELQFWYTLGTFVTLQYEDNSFAKQVDDTLSALRNLLDGRENRDILYSIAVIRGLGQRVSEYTESETPLHLDETDNKSRLLVAKKFVADEAAGSGTTNVIRRLCDLATRSWTMPTLPPISAHSTASPEPKH
ncbi:hypothetical protein LZ554_005030 [Drepanopeziza brunnea f. sp. 'monogermtubi']|nr:hypothetical protein LZ554_005030 [Drepanopeziza brunnea f. sp. 'monogermtubi']